VLLAININSDNSVSDYWLADTTNVSAGAGTSLLAGQCPVSWSIQTVANNFDALLKPCQQRTVRFSMCARGSSMSDTGSGDWRPWHICSLDIDNHTLRSTVTSPP